MSAEAERWREQSGWMRDESPTKKAGDALLAALEAERERVRRMGEDHAEYRRNAAAALEARDRRIAALEAGLRDLVDAVAATAGLIENSTARRELWASLQDARDLLAGRAAGGEG